MGIASNSHKAVVNLLTACGDAAREKGNRLRGIKVGGGVRLAAEPCAPVALMVAGDAQVHRRFDDRDVDGNGDVNGDGRPDVIGIGGAATARPLIVCVL